MRVVVFGPAREAPEFTALARRLGWFIGKNGHALTTGGCPGPVHEVAQAAFKRGCVNILAVSHVQFFDLDRPDRQPCYDKFEVASTLSARMTRMIDGVDLAIAFAGGSGTICEVEHALVDRPGASLVLVGRGWDALGPLTQALYRRLGGRGRYRWFHTKNGSYFASASIKELLRA